MTLPTPQTTGIGKFTFPATQQAADLESAATASEANDTALEQYINQFVDAVKADIQSAFDAINEEHP